MDDPIQGASRVISPGDISIWFYVVVGLLNLIVGALGAYLGGFFSKRGETDAIHRDREKLLEFLREQKADEAHFEAISDRRRILREKLEELIIDLGLASDERRSHVERAMEGQFPWEQNQTVAKMRTIQLIYFPRANDIMTDYMESYGKWTETIGKFAISRVNGAKELPPGGFSELNRELEIMRHRVVYYLLEQYSGECGLALGPTSKMPNPQTPTSTRSPTPS